MMHKGSARRFARTSIVLLLATFVLSIALRTEALAGARLFTVVSGMGMICEIDPVAGTEIFSFNTPGMGSDPGLAFNGVELFYTDETLGVVKVYLPDGTFVRDLPKPGIGPEAGAGLGVSRTSLYGVGVGGSTVTAIDPFDGTFQGSFALSGAKDALTYAGSRGTLFARVGSDGTIAEVQPDGTVVNTFAGPTTNIRGLAFSSSLNRLFSVVTGSLYGLDPDTGAVLPGYPVAITGADGYAVPKSGAAAADELVQVCGDDLQSQDEECDDGNQLSGDGCSATCRREYCGDGVVQASLGEECETPGTPGCDERCQRTEICSNLIDDDGNGLADCEDPTCPACLPIKKDPGRIRFSYTDDKGDYFDAHGSFAPATSIDLFDDTIGILLTNANGVVYRAELPAGSLKQSARSCFGFRDKTARKEHDGVVSVTVRFRPAKGDYAFKLKAYGDLSAATEPLMTLQWRVGDDVFINTGEWTKTARGWTLELPGE